MREAFWNGLFDVRWEEAPLGAEAIRLTVRLRERGYAERTCRGYGHAVVHLGAGVWFRGSSRSVPPGREYLVGNGTGSVTISPDHLQELRALLVEVRSSRTPRRRVGTTAPPSS